MAKKKQQQPWVVQFNGTSKPVLVAPFDGWRTHVVDMAVLQGKRCLGLDGDWSLMLEELTNDCSLVSLANSSPSAPTVIALPPLPETPPPYLRFGCALSNQSPPNCTVLLGLVREKSLLHCRPGDAEWSRLPVDIEDWEEFDGPITPGHNGKVYATTMGSLVAVDSSKPTPVVEWTDLRHPPPCPVHERYKCYPIPCPDGELFLVRSCLFGCHPELVDVKIFRWNQEDNVWEIVDSIGDQTFFVGRFSFVVPSAAEAGTQPNRVHILKRVCGECGIYTVSLDDMTIRLSILEGCDQDDEVQETFWALPNSFGLEAPQAADIDDLATEVMQRGTEHCCIESIEEEKEAMTSNIEPSQAVERSPGRLVAPNNKEISFIDFLSLKAVCKQWNSTPSPIQDAKVSPLLMTTRPGKTNDLLEVFDPVSEKKYSISVRIPVSHLKSQGPQLLHFAKDGWVIVSKGVSRGGDDHMFFLVNPFKNYPDGVVIALPPLNILHLKGISFSSVPGSPDFMVLAAGASADGKVVIVQTWRIGDEHWKEECLGNDDGTFLMASHSPVFLDGVFYFLDINGRLGVVDPNEEDMEWNVLEKPDQPIRGSDEVHTIGEWDYSYLVEWKRELVAILHECGDNGSIRIFKLDRSRMVWTELEEMEDAAVFWDKSNNALIARPTPGENLCNKVYLPNYTETDDGGRAQAFYCLKKRQYYPSFNAKEPLNAIWFQPNLEDVLGDVCMQSVS